MKKRNFIKNENAVLGFFLAFIFSATMLVFLFSFAIPFLTSFTVDLYVAGDSIIANAEEEIDNIQNATIKNQIQSNLQDMQAATQENINYMSFFYQYGWVFVILIITFTFFMLARSIVETKGYGVV